MEADEKRALSKTALTGTKEADLSYLGLTNNETLGVDNIILISEASGTTTSEQ